MPKLRVAFFIDAIKSGAGTENQLIGLIERLDPDRFESWLYTLREPVAPELADRLPCRCECLHLGSLRSPATLGRFLRVVGFLRREQINVAMIYFVDSQLLIPLATRLSPATRCVVNRRDMGYWYTPRLLKLLRRVNRWVDYFLVNARAIRDLVSEREQFPREQIEVIYNAHAIEETASHEIERTQLGLPEEVPLVGLVANLRPVKRIDRFLEMAAQVVARVDNARFVILGGGELRQELGHQAESLGLADKVVFAGAVADVSPYLKHFAVGVLTSESEGLSNTLIEYSANRVPVVAFNNGGNSEVVESGQTGYLVAENDLDQMAEAVVKLLEDPVLAGRLGEAGYRRVAELFATDRIDAEFEAFLRLVARERKGTVRFD